jgi:small GTP-binding protein
MSILTKKICLIGDFAVGKTSLIRQFVERQFSDQYLSTVGVKISKKQISPANSAQTIQLLIWDIEGQTKFKSISSSYFQGAAGAIVVGDVTRAETMEQLSEHLQLFWKVNPKSQVVLALNKSDLLDPERLSYLMQSLAFNSEQLVGKYPTSAKTGINVDEIFQTLATKFIAA